MDGGLLDFVKAKSTMFLDPYTIVIVSIEENKGATQFFWDDELIKQTLNGKLVFNLRLSRDTDQDYVNQFLKLSKIDYVPSISVFGAGSTSVTCVFNELPEIGYFVKFMEMEFDRQRAMIENKVLADGRSKDNPRSEEKTLNPDLAGILLDNGPTNGAELSQPQALGSLNYSLSNSGIYNKHLVFDDEINVTSAPLDNYFQNSTTSLFSNGTNTVDSVNMLSDRTGDDNTAYDNEGADTMLQKKPSSYISSTRTVGIQRTICRVRFEPVNGKYIAKEFSADDTFKVFKDYVSNEFGEGCTLESPVTRQPYVYRDDEKLRNTRLFPSARVAVGNITNVKPELTSTDIQSNPYNSQPPPVEEHLLQDDGDLQNIRGFNDYNFYSSGGRGKIANFFCRILSCFNPWSDVEELEDIFQRKDLSYNDVQ